MTLIVEKTDYPAEIEQLRKGEWYSLSYAETLGLADNRSINFMTPAASVRDILDFSFQVSAEFQYVVKFWEDAYDDNSVTTGVEAARCVNLNANFNSRTASQSGTRSQMLNDLITPTVRPITYDWNEGVWTQMSGGNEGKDPSPVRIGDQDSPQGGSAILLNHNKGHNTHNSSFGMGLEWYPETKQQWQLKPDTAYMLSINPSGSAGSRAVSIQMQWRETPVP